MSLDPLVTPDSIPPHAVLCDVRFRLGDPTAGRDAYDKGHIPGAIYFDLEHDLSDMSRPGGRHPLPAPADFTQLLGRSGILPDTPVVACDDAGGAVAARLWWMLRSIGHDRAAVLDGGIQAWMAAGGRLDTGVPSPRPTAYPAAEWTGVVDWRGAAEAAREGRLIDARSPARFRGDKEPIDPIAGHIPRARNIPHTEMVTPDGLMRPPPDLAARVGDVAGDHVVYCGSGVTVARIILAAAHAGRPQPRLYAGSWSDWIARPGAPVATGPA